jgi:hypothetical protein
MCVVVASFSTMGLLLVVIDETFENKTIIVREVNPCERTN